MFKNKNVLITGGTGLIGRKLTDLLVKEKANVTIASLDKPKDLNLKNIIFKKLDLRYLDNCVECTKNQEVVFHLAGIKGSPKMCDEKPASFLTPTVTFSFNMLEASRINGVKNYLLTSSVGVYSPADVFNEDDVWKTFPSKNDWFAGWGKRICELQAEAYSKQYNWNNIHIVRPANVYGPYDNFHLKNSHFIPALIKKFIEAKRRNKKFVEIWGSGLPRREVMHVDDLADAIGYLLKLKINNNKRLLKILKNNSLINVGSGQEFQIKKFAEIINRLTLSFKKLRFNKKFPDGTKRKILDNLIMKKIGWKSKIKLYDGLKNTISWYKANY